MNAASAQVAQFGSKTTAQLSSIEASFKTLTAAAEALGIAFGLEELVDLGKNALDASMKVQSLQFQLIAATGSTEAAGEAMQFATDLADKLGLKVLDVGKGFAQFALNAIGSGMSLKDAEDAYVGFTEAMTAVQISSTGVTRSVNMLAEMMTAPTVQLRQLRALAMDSKISFDEMGKSIGVSSDTLLQMVHDGKLATDDFLPKLAAQLDKDFGDVATAASESLRGNLNRLSNEWLLLQAAFGQNGGLQAANVGVYGLSAAMKDLMPVAVAAGQTLGGLEIIIAKLWEEFQLASSEADGLVDAFVAVFTTLGGFETALGQLQSGNITGAFDTLKTASQGLGTELDKAAADEAARSKQILDDYNKTVKAITTPYAMPDIDRDAQGQKSKGGKQTKPTKVTQNQVDAVEKYAADDDDAQRLQIQLAEHQAILDKAHAQGLISTQKYNQDELALELDYDKRMADYVTKNFGTEVEQENQNYKDSLDRLNKALQEKIITQEQYQLDVQKLDKDHKTKLIAAENAYNKSMKSDQQDGIEGFLGIQLDYQQTTASQQGASFANSIQQAGQYNRTFFELAKAAAIAKALLSARQAVVDSYAFGASLGGPPLGAVFAGVAAAAEAVNIAAIASTSFGGGGSVSNSGGSSAAVATTNSGSTTSGTSIAPSKQVFINLTSGTKLFTDTQVRDLLKQINDALSDGAQLNVVGVN